ncbi:MAG: DUF4058 family protein [Anaerolineae bacterium]|nr:DUF4058 family protein [Anaerolineae bacterium]
MVIKTRDNLYKGVNAHFMSQCFDPMARPSMWHSFHTHFITNITQMLNSQLDLGYIARAEQSLQVWIDNFDTGEFTKKMPIPDSSIFQVSEIYPSGDVKDVASSSNDSVHVLPIRETLLEDVLIPSVVIYKPDEHLHLGDPITRIELLSPSNKIGEGKQIYLQNRTYAIWGKTSLVEIDFIHFLPPLFRGLEVYPDDEHAHPYWIGITDVRIDVNPKQLMLFHVFRVDDVFPEKISIPLAQTDSLLFDLNEVYRQTFIGMRCGYHIDYAQLPPLFDTYSLQDQERIKAVMERAKPDSK